MDSLASLRGKGERKNKGTSGRVAHVAASVLLPVTVLALVTAVLVNPAFVAKHLSEDGVLERITIVRIQLVRACTACVGLVLAYCSVLAVIVAFRSRNRQAAIAEDADARNAETWWRSQLKDIPTSQWVLRRWDAGIIQSGLIFAAVFAFYLLHVSPTVLSGDCAVYNEQIRSLVVTGRTVHFGYFVQGIIFTHLLPWLKIDLAMNIMACLYGAVGIVAVFLLVRYLTGNTVAGFISAVVLTFANDYMCLSLFSEVHAAQAGLAMVAFLAWFTGRARLAGRLCLYDMLVTPQSFVILPVFLGRKFSWRDFRTSALACVPWYLIFLAVFWRDYLFGPRGVVKWGTFPGVSSLVDLLPGYKVTLYLLWLSFGFSGLLVLIGLLHGLLGRSAQLRRFVVACSGAVCLHLIVNGHVTVRGYDVVIYPIIAAMAGVGFHACMKRNGARIFIVCGALLAISYSAWVSYHSLMPYVHYVEARDKSYEHLATSEKAEWFSTVNWDVRMMYEWKAFRRAYTAFFVDPEAEDFEERVAQILRKGEPLWILGNGAEPLVAKVRSGFPNVEVEQGPSARFKWWRITE